MEALEAVTETLTARIGPLDELAATAAGRRAGDINTSIEALDNDSRTLNEAADR